ncbi:MAG: hypothetical protein WC802_01695 [Patescibacteria group bacterium]
MAEVPKEFSFISELLTNNGYRAFSAPNDGGIATTVLYCSDDPHTAPLSVLVNDDTLIEWAKMGLYVNPLSPDETAPYEPFVRRALEG